MVRAREVRISEIELYLIEAVYYVTHSERLVVVYLALNKELVVVEFLGQPHHLAEVLNGERGMSHQVLPQLLQARLWVLGVLGLHSRLVLHRLQCPFVRLRNNSPVI